MLSGLDERPIRWMVDDASKFTAREVRRGRRYDGILLDPPKFGRGPEGEVWRLEDNLAPLLADCRQLLDADSRFLVLTVYAVRMSALAIGELVRQMFGDLGGTVEVGEMAVREEARGLLLPTAIFARWSKVRGARMAAPAANGAPSGQQQRNRRLEQQQRPPWLDAARRSAAAPRAAAAADPASAPARGRPAVSAATATASAASPAVPMASASSVRPSEGAVDASSADAGNAASSSSGAKVSQWATILAAAMLSSATPRSEQLVEHAVGAVGLNQPFDRQQRRGQCGDPQGAGADPRKQARIGPDRERQQRRDQQEEGDRKPGRAAKPAANIARDQRADQWPSSSLRHSPASGCARRRAPRRRPRRWPPTSAARRSTPSASSAFSGSSSSHRGAPDAATRASVARLSWPADRKRHRHVGRGRARPSASIAASAASAPEGERRASGSSRSSAA